MVGRAELTRYEDDNEPLVVPRTTEGLFSGP